jgi:hypothetical protein
MNLDKRLEERRQAVELRAMKSTSRTIMATFVVAILAMVAYRAFFPGDAYALYRVADDDPKTRTLVATFDSEEGAETNKDNCETVLAAMQQQKPAYKLRYTCDRGRW